MTLDRRVFLRSAGIGFAGALSGIAPRALAGDAIAAQQVPGLAALARGRGMTFGIATISAELENERFGRLLARNAVLTLTRNDLKWKRVEPVRGRRDYRRADSVASFARANGLALRGHNVVWNMDVFMPDWLVEIGKDDAARARRAISERLWHHGHRLATRFPQIVSWDVVNEAVSPRSGRLRRSTLTRTFGESFIDLSFQIMRDKAPRAQLVYNDIADWRRDPTHRNGVLRLLEGALRRGVPIDALGIESHLGPNLGRPVDLRAWSGFLKEVSDMGLEIVLTELDCDDRNLGRVGAPERDRIFADEIRRYLDVTLDNTAVRQVVSWTGIDNDVEAFWRTRNRPSWIPKNQRMVGGLFDRTLSLTPTYHAIARAFAGAPRR